MNRAGALLLAVLLGMPMVTALSGNETAIDVRVWYGALHGNRPDITGDDVWIELLDLDTGTRYALDDPHTRARICRSGDTTDVCAPPGGDAFDPAEQHRAYATFQPHEWDLGDRLQVTVRMLTNLSQGVAVVPLYEGGVVVDVILRPPVEGIDVVVAPAVRHVDPGETSVHLVRATNNRLVPDVIDLTLVGAPPHPGWTVALGASATPLLDPGTSFTTTLTVTTPPERHQRYAPQLQPAQHGFLVQGVARGEPDLFDRATATVVVPLVLGVKPNAPLRLLGLACPFASAETTHCYADPRQEIRLNVTTTWASGTPVPGVAVDVDILYLGIPPTTPLVDFGPRKLFGVTGPDGSVEVVVPHDLHVLTLLSLHRPGEYLYAARGIHYDHAGVKAGYYGVDRVT